MPVGPRLFFCIFHDKWCTHLQLAFCSGQALTELSLAPTFAPNTDCRFSSASSHTCSVSIKALSVAKATFLHKHFIWFLLFMASYRLCLLIKVADRVSHSVLTLNGSAHTRARHCQCHHAHSHNICFPFLFNTSAVF